MQTYEREKTFTILWPERRVVSEKTIKTWYSDAVSDGILIDTKLTDPTRMATALHNEGLITLGRD